MMAGKNKAALAVCAQTKVIFPFKSLSDCHEFGYDMRRVTELAICRRKVEEMSTYVGCSRNMSPYHVHCRGELMRFLNGLKISPQLGVQSGQNFSHTDLITHP